MIPESVVWCSCGDEMMRCDVRGSEAHILASSRSMSEAGHRGSE